MKPLTSFTIPSNADGSDMLLAEGEDSKTYLAFSQDFLRFVALKVYTPERQADTRTKNLFAERAAELRARYSSGLAFPLEVGEQDQRLYQATELLPGHALQKLVEKLGPLPAPAVMKLAKEIMAKLELSVLDHKIKPSLAPADVFTWGTSGRSWSVGFADYDLRPLHDGEEFPGELQTVQELSLLLYFLGTGDLQAWFYPMLNSDLSQDQHPTIDPDLLAFYQQLFDGNASHRPFSFSDMHRLLDHTISGIGIKAELSSIPVERPFLHWMPVRGSFPEPYAPKGRLAEIDQPCSYEAVDKLRDSTSLVHILPPDSMTLSCFVDEYRQSMQLAQGKESTALTPVETVMCDPRCRVVAEKPLATISLSSLMERDAITATHAINILDKVNAALKQVQKEEFEHVSLRPNDIFLKPEGVKSRQAVMSQTSFAWLDKPNNFQIYLRPFHANLFYSETIDFTALNGPAGKFGRTGAILNPFRPEYEFNTLAYVLLASAMRKEDSSLPKATAELFRTAFAAKPDSKREKFVASLRRSLGSKPKRAKTAVTPVVTSAPATARTVAISTVPEYKAKREAWGKIPLSALGLAALLVGGLVVFFSTPIQQRLIASSNSNAVEAPDGTVNLLMEPIPEAAVVEDVPPSPVPVNASESEQTVELVSEPVAAEAAAPEVIVMEEVPETIPVIETPVEAPQPAETVAESSTPETAMPLPEIIEPISSEAMERSDDEVTEMIVSTESVPANRPLGSRSSSGTVQVVGAPREEVRATPIVQAEDLVTTPSTLEQEERIGRTSEVMIRTIAATTPSENLETPLVAQPTASAGSNGAADASLMVEASIGAGESMDFESLNQAKEKKELVRVLDRIREKHRSGDIGAASKQLTQVLENYADEPMVSNELDSVMSSIRDRQSQLTPQQRNQAEELVQLAAINQHFGAVSLLASWSDQSNSPTAVPWNERAAEQGDPDAMARLGLYYSTGKHVEADSAKAVKWFERASKLEQVDALYYLGECYFFGKGVDRDPARAVGLLNRAHEQGDSRASDMLATCYAKGQGVESNHPRARELYEESIRRGNTTALGNLGVLYLQDRGIDRDEEKAFDLFRQGAEAGATNAMVLFALSHERGVGTEQNQEVAERYYIKAAQQGHPAAIQWCRNRQLEF